MHSTSAVVMVRPSNAVEDQTILIQYNTRHAKRVNLAEHGKGYAFQTSHADGNWTHTFLDIVDVHHHFGPNVGNAPVELVEAGKFDKSTIAQLKKLHRDGHSYLSMEKTMRQRQPGVSINRKSIADYFKKALVGRRTAKSLANE